MRIFFGSSIQEVRERLKLDFLANPNLLSLFCSEITFPPVAAVVTVIWWSGEAETMVAAIVSVPTWSMGLTVLAFSGVHDPLSGDWSGDEVSLSLPFALEWSFLSLLLLRDSFLETLLVTLGLEEEMSLWITWEKLSTSIVTYPSGLTGVWIPGPISWPVTATPVSIDLWELKQRI